MNGTKVILTPLIHAHPEVDAHGGDEAAGQERSVFKTHQQTRFPHARVSDQHHLHNTREEETGKAQEPLLES